MKKFSFPLERVLSVRRIEQDTAERTLARLQRNRQTLADRQTYLNGEQRQAAEQQRSSTILTSIDLGTFAAYQKQMADERVSLQKRSIEAEKKVAEQQSVVADLERGCRLIEKLREKHRFGWQRNNDREIDEAASDAFLSRWGQQS